MMAKKKGFFADTRRKVIQRQRSQLQSWFVRHPISFGAVAGVKGLAWDLPKWATTSIYGKYKTKTKKVEKESGETVTVVEHMDADGHISTTTTTRTQTASAQVTAPSKRPALATVSPAERAAVLQSSKQLLTRTPLGQAFLQLAGEIDAFSPVRGAEAISTEEMLHQSSRGLARISMGVEAFADAVSACGLSRKITGHVNGAAENADQIARTMGRAHKLTLSLYSGQITQDMSGAASLSAVPVPVGVGDEAAGIWPYSNKIANHYGLFEPSVDQEATEVYTYLGISQAGWALLSDMLTVMPDKLRKYGIDKRVSRLVTGAAGTALDASITWSNARKGMTQLYQGQMSHEASGVTTIRTTPLKYKAAA